MDRISISVGKHARDQFWQPWEGTQDEFCATFFSQWRYGQKDGPCIISGKLAGPDRGSNVTVLNSIVMLDHDNGITPDEVEQKIIEAGLRGIVWTTHSHLKETTDLGQGGIVAHRRKKKFGEAMADVEVVRDYLRERKQWTEEMLASIHATEDVMDPKKGMQVRVKHGPMPKCRSLFILEEPFYFTAPGMVQKDRIAEWKDRIKGMAYRLGLPFDSACQDPAHLMYLPACRNAEVKETNGHEIRFIDGHEATLQFDFVRYTETAAPSDVRREREAADLPTTFATLGLGTFIRRDGPGDTFRAADWFRDQSGQEPRRIADGIKVHFECPNDAEHSNAGDPKDTAFFTQNADPSESRTWMLHCRHDSCISRFAGDRARLLDYACGMFGVTDANDLLPYTDADTLGSSTDDALYDAVGDVDSLIAELTKESSAVVVNTIINYLARFPADLITQEKRKREVAVKTGLGTRAVSNAIKASAPPPPTLPRETQSIPGAEEFTSEAPTPPDDPSETRTIWKEWSFEDKMRVLVGVIEHLNAEKKLVFTTSDGIYVRARATQGGIAFVPVEGASDWTNICYDLGVRFATTERLETGEPFANLMKVIARRQEMNFPYVERAVEVPVFGEDGSLETTPGYHEGAKVYLDPRIDFLPVPPEISDEHLDEALAIFDEVSQDFPFSDHFEGSDPLPVRVDGRPNFERGVSSRANFYAMLLQPFARSLIGRNATPMYFIDKSEKGTGANYLANILGYMMYGTPMPPQVVSEQEEELKKTITASLYAGAPTIFFDNLNHELSSQSLAAALTSGIWTDRLLGKSQILRLPVSAVWMLAANNGQISEELQRRVVPIRLDAALSNPATDRPKSFYGISDLPRWCSEHRQHLIWAAHVLIRRYIEVRQTPDRLEEARALYPVEPLQSFFRWTEVMGDVLACAGVNGFLANVSDYRADRKSNDKEGLELYMGALFARYGGEPFTVPDALEVLQKPFASGLGALAGGDTPDPRYGITFPNRISRDDLSGKIQWLGIHFGKLRGRVFELEDRSQVQIVHLPRNPRKGSRWKLVLTVYGEKIKDIDTDQVEAAE